MERAGKLLAKSARAVMSRDELAAAAWPAAAGRTIANRTRVAGLVRERLVVEVDDILWQRNLHGLRRQILANFAELLDDAAPKELEFRIGVPRRPPQREGIQLSASQDEADAISDPIWRHLYKASRRKATA